MKECKHKVLYNIKPDYVCNKQDVLIKNTKKIELF